MSKCIRQDFSNFFFKLCFLWPDTEPESELLLVKSRNRNRNRHRNFSKVGDGTGTATNSTRYGFTTLQKRNYLRKSSNIDLFEYFRKIFCLRFPAWSGSQRPLPPCPPPCFARRGHTPPFSLQLVHNYSIAMMYRSLQQQSGWVIPENGKILLMTLWNGDVVVYVQYSKIQSTKSRPHF
jgi:hypothetical protein